MLIQGKGIAVEADVRGSILTYRVVEQNKEASTALTILGVIRDKDTGYSLRTNNFPSYNVKKKRFFVRGKDREQNERTVVVDLKSEGEANRAFQALQKMITKVAIRQASPDGIGVVYNRGGTSGVRFALIKRSQAMFLDLTGKKHYPDERFWVQADPVITANRHYNEHIGQVVDVLNKAHQAETVNDENVVNPHKVTQHQAHQAVDAVRRLFDEAEAGGYLVAMWRTITGIRGPDHVDEIEKKKEPNPEDIPRHPGQTN